MVIITIFIYILSMNLPFIKNNLISSTILVRRLCAISFIYIGVLLYNTLSIQLIGSGIGIYSGLFQINILSNFISLFIVIISAIMLLVWPNIINNKTQDQRLNFLGLHEYKNIKIKENYNRFSNNNKSNEYCLIILFNILGALFLVSSSDLVSMYLSIELQSFGLYILATLYKEKLSATSAGLKYFLLGGLSSCIILLGSGLIYTYTGLTNLELINTLNSIFYKNDYDFSFKIISKLIENFKVYEDFFRFSSNLDITSPAAHAAVVDYSNLISEKDNIITVNDKIKGVSIGYLLIFSGFLFKIAASPFHNWAPDVYDDSPTLVTIWLTIMPKISILILLLQLLIGTNIHLYNFYDANAYTDITESVAIGFDSIKSFFSNFFFFDSRDSGSVYSYLAGESSMVNGVQLPDINTIIKENSNISNIIQNYWNNMPHLKQADVLIILLLLSSLLSLIVGAIVGLSQIRIKRLLAYSTINHIGFLLLSLSVFSNSSIESFIFYLIQYTITNLNIFLIILALSYIINYSIEYSYHNENQDHLLRQQKQIDNLLTGSETGTVIAGLSGSYLSAQAAQDPEIFKVEHIDEIPQVLPLDNQNYPRPHSQVGLNIYNTLFGLDNLSKYSKGLGLKLYEYINILSANSLNTTPDVANLNETAKNSPQILKSQSLEQTKLININISDIEYINSFKGLFYKNPILCISLAICLFSFAGVPPLMGFFAKQQILYSSNSAGFYFLSLIAIIVSVISAFYYLKIIKILYTPCLSSSSSSVAASDSYLAAGKIKNLEIQDSLKKTKELGNYGSGFNNVSTLTTYKFLSNVHSFLIGTLTISIMIFILNPELLLNSIAIITSLIFNL